ncbi:MAG: molybdenum cofactor guanylyltransferase [Rhodocyclaceae bacterium]|nr:molybdenum cofactor guanylyltransferase [Rhodocyclaceae bacterium]
MAAKRSDITGLILAGGAGLRMGGADKGLLTYQGLPLIEHVIKRLAPQVETLLISANRNHERYARYGYPVLADEIQGFAGPLAGIATGLAACQTEWLAIVPCDVPDLAPDLVARLYEAASLAQGTLAVAVTEAGIQPTFSLCHRCELPALRDYFAHGERRLSRWCEMRQAVRVYFPDALAFANLNTPADLAR